MNQVNLPNVIKYTPNYLLDITSALNVPRDVLASDEEISEAWERLPRIISKIPPELRTKGIVKMCVAVSSGLFDSGINYIWNEAIIELRGKVKRFGLTIVGEITEKKDFDEGKLNDLQDSELLSLCLKLNLITEDGYFYLDQCRDIRNNFSAAHPTIGELDENELLNFSNRCIKHALCNEENPIGVNIGEFIESIKGGKHNGEQIKIWKEKIVNTHEAQKELLISKLYGIYCDENSTEETRVNALNLSTELLSHFTPSLKSKLISLHQGYILKDKIKSKGASVLFFEKLGILDLLGKSEQHNIVDKACKNLYNAHTSMNNFYNEHPFAERLYEITTEIGIPSTIKFEFVEVVLACGIGNSYGVARKAFPIYKKIVSNFSPKEIELMFNMVKENTSYIGKRIDVSSSRRTYFKLLIEDIDSSSIPTSVKNEYEKWKK